MFGEIRGSTGGKGEDIVEGEVVEEMRKKMRGREPRIITPEYRSSSPLMSPVALSDDAAPELDQEIPPDSEKREVVVEDDGLAWLLADSDDAGEVASSPTAQHCQRPSLQPSDTIEIEASKQENESPVVLTSSPVRSHAHSSLTLPNCDMPPPALLPPPYLRLEHDIAAPIPIAPSPSLPI